MNNLMHNILNIHTKFGSVSTKSRSIELSEHVIRSKLFLRSTILDTFSLTYQEEQVQHVVRSVQLCLHTKVFGLNSVFFFAAKIPFLVFEYKKGWAKYAYDIPLVTLYVCLLIFDSCLNC